MARTKTFYHQVRPQDLVGTTGGGNAPRLPVDQPDLQGQTGLAGSFRASGLETAQQVRDLPVEVDEDVLDLDLKWAIDEYQEGPVCDRPEHLSIIFDVTVEEQVLTHIELNYIHRLYRIPTDTSVRLVGPGEDPVQPLQGLQLFQRGSLSAN